MVVASLVEKAADARRPMLRCTYLQAGLLPVRSKLSTATDWKIRLTSTWSGPLSNRRYDKELKPQT